MYSEYNCSQLLTRKALRLNGEPYPANSLHIKFASLQDNDWTDNTNGLQQGTMTIAGNGFKFHSKGKQVSQVFL